MKKIMLSLAFTAAIFSAKAQANQKNNSRELVSSSTSNSKEDPHNPLVNGIPYSQYKQQIEAEKKKKADEIAKEKTQQKLDLEKMNNEKMKPIQSLQNSKREEKLENTNSKK